MKLQLERNKDFIVDIFMRNIETDFIYAHSEDTYTLLNESMYGEFARQDIDKQIDSGLKVVIISNKPMELESHNLDEMAVVQAVQDMYIKSGG